jgi:hypothetical protein
MKSSWANQRPATTVIIRCRHDHDCRVSIDDVAVVHADGHVVGLRFDCPVCCATNDVVSSTQVAAVVHAFGARADTTDATIEPALAGEPQHQILSLRVLLDDPDVMSRFAESPRGDVVEDVEIDAET